MQPLTTKEVAQRLGVTEGWVRVLCISGQLEGASKHGRAWMIPPEAIEKYLALNDRTPATDTNEVPSES